jgi:hypothetical protein
VWPLDLTTQQLCIFYGYQEEHLFPYLHGDEIFNDPQNRNSNSEIKYMKQYGWQSLK